MIQRGAWLFNKSEELQDFGPPPFPKLTPDERETVHPLVKAEDYDENHPLKK